jgi:hypothetical protein
MLVHTADPHQTVLIRVGLEPQFKDVIVFFIGLNIGNGNMIVKINYGQILCDLKIKPQSPITL